MQTLQYFLKNFEVFSLQKIILPQAYRYQRLIAFHYFQCFFNVATLPVGSYHLFDQLYSNIFLCNGIRWPLFFQFLHHSSQSLIIIFVHWTQLFQNTGNTIGIKCYELYQFLGCYSPCREFLSILLSKACIINPKARRSDIINQRQYVSTSE